MREKKLNIKRQLFLESIPWVVVFGVNIVDNFNLASSDINKILGVGAWIVLAITFFISLKEKEAIDESAQLILGKVDGICLQIVIATLLISSITIGVIRVNSGFLSMNLIGSFLGGIAFIILFLRAILFSYYDKKGI